MGDTKADPSMAPSQGSREAALLRLAQHLATEWVDGGGYCELTDDGARCRGEDVAVRWEDGFADLVCERHAESARQRGALVVYPKRHDGTSPQTQA